MESDTPGKNAFENLWGEHCSYRSTRKFPRTLPTKGDNVILSPGDDAAIVKFTDNIALSIVMEFHNHPSYINPYSSAATGVGGIVRDVFSMEPCRSASWHPGTSAILLKTIHAGFSSVPNRAATD